MKATLASRNPGPILDVTLLPPRQRHPLIFNTWAALADGASLLLHNDHDPLPLYYQFAAEHAGEFHWEYLERGPDRWTVRIHRGSYPDPGFVPFRDTPPRSAPVEFADLSHLASPSN